MPSEAARSRIRICESCAMSSSALPWFVRNAKLRAARFSSSGIEEASEAITAEREYRKRHSCCIVPSYLAQAAKARAASRRERRGEMTYLRVLIDRPARMPVFGRQTLQALPSHDLQPSARD